MYKPFNISVEVVNLISDEYFMRHRYTAFLSFLNTEMVKSLLVDDKDKGGGGLSCPDELRIRNISNDLSRVFNLVYWTNEVGHQLKLLVARISRNICMVTPQQPASQFARFDYIYIYIYAKMCLFQISSVLEA